MKMPRTFSERLDRGYIYATWVLLVGIALVALVGCKGYNPLVDSTARDELLGAKAVVESELVEVDVEIAALKQQIEDLIAAGEDHRIVLAVEDMLAKAQTYSAKLTTTMDEIEVRIASVESDAEAAMSLLAWAAALLGLPGLGAIAQLGRVVAKRGREVTLRREQLLRLVDNIDAAKEISGEAGFSLDGDALELLNQRAGIQQIIQGRRGKLTAAGEQT